MLEGGQQWTPEQGTPQGAVISPLLSNIYLDPLDHLMARSGFEMVRYADDFVVLCRTPEEAAEALAVVRDWTAQAGLTLHPVKTRLVDARTDGFDFLGYHFEAGQRWPRAKSLTKFKDTIRAKTKRTTGRSLAMVIDDLNPTLRGWFGYFQHSRERTFGTLDGWIRRRLRSLLRKQQKLRGIAGTVRIRHAGPIASLPTMGCSACRRPMSGSSVPLRVRPPTGEPDAGDPPVRFGGRGCRDNRCSLPLSRLFFVPHSKVVGGRPSPAMTHINMSPYLPTVE